MGRCIRDCLFDENLSWWKLATIAAVIMAAGVIASTGTAAVAIVIAALAGAGFVLAMGVIFCILGCLVRGGR